jgi:hypothetical protein
MARTVISTTPNATVTARMNTAVNTEGVVESVEDIIELISPYETPFYSQLPKVDCKDIQHYWQQDELRAASRANNKVLGYRPSAASGADFNATTPAMLFNYVQLFTETASVAGTMRRVQTYGRGDELDYQIMKRGRELKRDIEASLLSDNSPQAPVTGGVAAGYPFGPTGTAGRMGGAFQLIFAETAAAETVPNRLAGNHNVGTGGDVTGTAGAGALTVTTGTNRDFSEAILLATQQVAWEAGGTVTQAIMSAKQAQIMANFAYIDPTGGNNAQRARVLEGANETTITNVVDVYRSPYGTVAVIIDRFTLGALAADTEASILLADPDLWALGRLREMQSEALGKVGDSEEALLTAEYTLVNRNTKGSACIRDLNK